LFVHAHYDDYEFTAAGTFAEWRKALGRDFVPRVLVCTDGAAGHHRLTRRETARRRLTEQRASARLGGYDFKLLRFPGGGVPREGCLQPNTPFLAALWKAIRDFQPDYLFCPPLPADPLAGVHADHLVVADGIRRVAYFLNVPHAFTPEFPADERRSAASKVPVILHTTDSYMAGARSWDIAVDIESVFEEVALLSWQHQSQIREWLPWVGRHAMEVPKSLADWETALRKRFQHRQRQWGIRRRSLVEVFSVTAWGEVPNLTQLQRDFPRLMGGASLDRLRRRLRSWRC
jgi:LmbE family N-acetylglucosaminyl deacetylase